MPHKRKLSLLMNSDRRCNYCAASHEGGECKTVNSLKGGVLRMPSKNLEWTKEWMWEYVVRVTSCVYDF